MDGSQQAQAFIIAHRVLLAYLVKALHQAVPTEAEPTMQDATATMLRNSLSPIFQTLPQPLRDQMIAVAGAEVDRILIAPILSTPAGQ